MKLFATAPKLRLAPVWGSYCLLIFAVAGCNREEVTAYKVPKTAAPDASTPGQAPGAAAAAGMPGAARAVPQLGWQLPKDWKETGRGEFSVAGFTVNDEKGRKADIAVTQLGNLAGKDAMLVNMWREQAGATALSEEEAAKQMQPVTVGGEKGSLFEVSGTRDKAPVKIVTAMVHRPEGSWFYKMAGEPTLVDEQKPAFLEFLKSIQIKDAPAQETPPAATPSTPLTITGAGAPDASQPQWQPPANWQATAPGQMLRAKFAVPGDGGTRADVNIGPAGGGALANMARWRKQLTLPTLEDPALQALLTPVDVGGDKAVMIDLTGTNAMNQKPARLVGIMVTHGGEDWYYKLMGDTAVVEKEKTAFVQFVKGVKYAQAP